MNIKVDFDNIVVKEDKNDFNVKVLMLKGEKGDKGDGEANVIEKVQVNGTNLPVTNKTVNVPVPVVDSSISSSSTNPVQNSAIYNALSNKANTSALDNYYEISEIDALLGDRDVLLAKKPYYFDNVANMKAYNLEEGDYAITKGYYSANDGGSGEYVIVDDDTLVDDGGSIHVLTNGLRAKLIIDNETINFKQLGAKENDNTFDNKNYLLKYQTICNNLGKQIKLIIPSGDWYMSATHLARVGGFNIEGIGTSGARSFSAPTLKPIGNQDYIIKFGGESNMNNTQLSYNSTNTNNIINNLAFSSGNYELNYACLVLEYANYGFYDKLFFVDSKGTGLYIRSSWENYFGMMSFRSITDFSKPCLLFATARNIGGVGANISSSGFDKIMFENISGDCIKSEVGSAFVNNQFNEINVEYQYAHNDEIITDITNDTDLTNFIPIYLFNGNMSGVTFNTINWAGLSCYDRYITQNNNNYYLKSLFNSIGGGATENYRYDVNIGKISSRSILQILTSISPYRSAMKFSLGNYVETSNDSTNRTITKFDLLNAGHVHYDSIMTRINQFQALPFNSEKVYKFDSDGYLVTDNGALNDKICLKRPDGAITTLGFKYPFNYDSTPTTSKWLLRLKTSSTGNYSFVLRGYHNGGNVNNTYSASNLESNTWINVPITMNYDFNSDVKLVNLTEDVLLDTITLTGFNS